MSKNLQTDKELGTAIYLHNNTTYDQIPVNTANFQYSATTVWISAKEKINICNIYNQPHYNYNFEELNKIIKEIPQPKLIVGDFNCHSPTWDPSCQEPDRQGKKLEDMIEENKLICINEENTYTFFSKIHCSKTSVDVSICSENINDKLTWHVLEETFDSDHYPIVITYLAEENTETIKRFKTSKAKWEEFRKKTEEIPDFDSELEVNEAYEIIKTTILAAAEENIPTTGGKNKKKQVPWWNAELHNLVKEKHQLGYQIMRRKETIKKLAEKQGTRANIEKEQKLNEEIGRLKIEMNKVGAKFKRTAISEKEASWKNYVSKLTVGTPLSKVWKRFKKIKGSGNRQPKHALIHQGRRVHDSEEMARIHAEHLHKVSSDNNYTQEFLNTKRKKELKEIKFKRDEREKAYYNEKFTTEEFENALASTNKSAPGSDKIDFEIMKHMSEKAKKHLLNFYNHIWTKGTFPEEWRNAVIVPIPKQGKDPGQVTNYRPISLTSCLCKLLEKMVNVRLTWVLKEKKAITKHQYGSMKDRSTLDPLIQLEQHVRSQFKKKTPTIAVFFDMSKAYDTTWRYNILEKLSEIDLKGSLPIFIKNFLTDRTFQVRIDATHSDKMPLINGTPQGSVLSCTLFQLAVNAIVQNLPRQIRKSLYMDDFAIYCSSKRLDVASRWISLAIRKIETWSKNTGFQINTDKTKCVIFYRDVRWIKRQTINLEMNGEEIDVEEEYKFLGLIVDSHLNWKSHVAYTKNKCKRALGLLRKLSHTTWGADNTTLNILYKATVLPILDYACQIYSSATKTVLDGLNPVHNEGARIITGAFRSSPVTSIHVERGELPLDLHRESVVMKTATRIKASDTPTAQLFEERDDYEKQPPFPIRANRLLKQANIDVNCPKKRTITPPWTKLRITTCNGLKTLNKQTNPHICKMKAMEHINTKTNVKALYTDGSKNEHGVGYAVISATEAVQKSLPEYASVYTAELSAIYEALEVIERDVTANRFVIYTDSRSALEGINQLQPRNHIVCDIQERAHSIIIKGKEISICWIPAHVGVAGNEAADKAAKEAIQKERTTVQPPFRDIYPTIRRNQRRKWQLRWNAEPLSNKLRNIKETVEPWTTKAKLDRKTQVKLTRLRIGHTLVTHSHLMTLPRTDAAKCSRCDVTLTIQHIIQDCPHVNAQRMQTIGPNHTKDILGEEVRIASLMKYLRSVQIYDVI